MLLENVKYLYVIAHLSKNIRKPLCVFSDPTRIPRRLASTWGDALRTVLAGVFADGSPQFLGSVRSRADAAASSEAEQPSPALSGSLRHLGRRARNRGGQPATRAKHDTLSAWHGCAASGSTSGKCPRRQKRFLRENSVGEKKIFLLPFSVLWLVK